MRIDKFLTWFLFAGVFSIGVLGCSTASDEDRVIGTDAASSSSSSAVDEDSGDGGDDDDAVDSDSEEGANADAQDFQVQSGFTTGTDSIGTRYTSAGARLTNPNPGLASYGVQVLFNLVGASGDVLDSTTETIGYVGPGETVPVAPLQIGFDLKQKPVRLEVQVVGDFTADEGPQDSLGGDSAILTVKSAKITQSDFGRELDGQVSNPTSEVVTDASWDCIFVNGDTIAGGASSAIVDPIPPGATVQFNDFVSIDQLTAKTVECRVVTGF